jgi:hypothetical protein
MRKECAMIGLLFSGCIAPQCQGIVEMRKGKTVRQVKALSLAVGKYRLLRREHGEGVFQESEQSTPDFDIVEQDAMPQMSRIESDETEGLEE